tara:strand:- start:1105 stop:1419 length:315 start_codon:yes stop_codon:yes gene_type:complete
MNNYVVKTEDSIVQKVVAKMDQRSLVGQAKYGQTMQNEIDTGKKDLQMFLTDVQEEIMDALLYIEAAKACLQDEIEESMLKQYHGKDPETGKEYIINDPYEEEL